MDNDQAIFQKQEHKPLRAVPFLSTLQTSIFCCWWLWNPETFKSVFNELQVLKDQTLNSEALPGCCTEWHDLLHCRSDTSDTTEFAGFFNHTEIILKLNSWKTFSHISHRSWFLSSLTVFFPHSAMTCMLVYFYVFIVTNRSSGKHKCISLQFFLWWTFSSLFFPPSSLVKAKESNPLKKRKLKQWFFEGIIFLASPKPWRWESYRYLDCRVLSNVSHVDQRPDLSPAGCVQQMLLQC